MKRLPAKTVIIISGPTAVGKTSLAIRMARHFQTEIISADSRQCYRELNIGVARPSGEELAAVPHHFIASHAVRDEVTAAGFEQFALQKVNELFRDHDQVVMVGGTGLYIRAFCEGLDLIPEVPAAIREDISRDYAEKGLAWLQNEIRERDPAFFISGEIMNPQRMMRALEVLQTTGRSILDFRKGRKAVRDFRIVKIGLELPREELVRNINTRVQEMMEGGLLKEVRSLVPYRNLNALQTVGYTELFNYLDGQITLEEAVERIRINTRQYAKRQMTWFKKDSGLRWFSPASDEAILQYLEEQISNS